MKKISILLLLCASVLVGAAGCGNKPNSGDVHTPGGNGGDVGGSQQPTCGNGKVEKGETCDDNNKDAGDGCSDTCQIEDGYECPTEGQACSLIPLPSPVCGNGTVELGEGCDDNNSNSGDGCSSTCQIEDGYKCETEGQPCTLKAVCGNGDIEIGETCDDGNAHSGDGCDDHCHIEAGYECPGNVGAQGGPCKKLICGNGKLDPGETCDDGNKVGGDGCDAHCQVEPGYTCDSTKGCVKTTCGNGHKDAGEDCDLGGANNNGEYNKCRPNCTFPPRCGDGKIQAVFGETCDDGNTTPGDGCDANCHVEKPTSEPDKWVCPPNGGKCEKNACGNGTIDGAKGETCDDGNRAKGDGCDDHCHVEKGYVCQTAGQACSAKSCGDGVVASGEECDDGDNRDGDGCNRFCQVEDGWHCSTDPVTKKSVCNHPQCGNGVVEAPEECDDRNLNDNDGCSSTCKVEPGFSCNNQSGVSVCTNTLCGNGKIDPQEECDDSNTDDNDGCSHCRLQLGPNKSNFYCPHDSSGRPAPGACHGDTGNGTGTETCGNGILEGTEKCDDGNKIGGDGCDDHCQPESAWDCHKDPKTGQTKCGPVCGDGRTFTKFGEECDDGNLISGDGCSSTCKKEQGFTCTDFSSTTAPEIVVPVHIRDMRGEHEPNGNKDFELSAGIDPTWGRIAWTCANSLYKPTKNVVDARLAKDGKPVLSKDGLSCMSNKRGWNDKQKQQSFYWWFHDDPKHVNNFPIEWNMTLKRQSNGDYVFDSSKDMKGGQFFPIDDVTVKVGGKDTVKKIGFGNTTGFGHNYSFTTEFRTYFEYRDGAKLTFSGDDDLWVFINGRLALDIGGLHGRFEDSVTLKADTTKNGKPYNSKLDMYVGGVYELAIFHAERHSNDSNYKLTLSGFINTGKTICRGECGDGVVTAGEQCDDHNKTNGDGCNDQCEIEPGYTCHAGQTPYCVHTMCGDGKRQYPEECDPGDDGHGHVKTDDPYCSQFCEFNTCNDGHLDPGEDCDTLNGNTIVKPGDEAKRALCNGRCHFSTCGDGILEYPEECDDGNHVDNDTCTNSCKLPSCGDKVVTPGIGEQCDDGVNSGQYGSCMPGCQAKAPYCGDGVVQGTEECDEGATDSQVIRNCKSDCTFALYCGDGILSPGETCDDGNKKEGDGCNSDCTVTPGFYCYQDGPMSKCLTLG